VINLVKKNDYETYFLNNLYDDELITGKFAAIQNRIYNDILKGKEAIQNNKVINGHTCDIVLDEDLNFKYDVPPRSYSVQLRGRIIPYYSESEFAFKYGYGNVISSMDIMEDSTVFNKHLYFYINGYLINNLKIVINEDDAIIFIPTSVDDNVNMNQFQLEEIISEGTTWSLFFDTKSDFYSGYMSRSKLFTDNKIYISNLTKHKTYNRLVKNNSWTLYITVKRNSTDIMVGTNVKMQSDANGEYFLLSDNFKNFIYDKSMNFRCLIVNEPESTGNGIYINRNETVPIFTIPFELNPIPLKNLIIWKYDAENNIKHFPIACYDQISLIYPNIYDFTRVLTSEIYPIMYEDSIDYLKKSNIGKIELMDTEGIDNLGYDLYVEWVEPHGDSSKYDSYIQDYIDCYQNEFADMIINHRADPLIINFKPISGADITSEDYYSSQYKGDYRGWRLQKLIEMMGDNPGRYDEIFNLLYYNNKKYISRSYTYESHPHIYDRNIMTNRDFCEDKQELVIDFMEPQAYLRIHDFMSVKKPCFIYTNGVRHEVTYVSKWGHILYIYFPAELIANHETIQLNLDLVNEPIKSVNFIMGDKYSVESKESLEGLSLSDLIFYGVDDGEIYDEEWFNFYAKIQKVQLKYLGDSKIDAVSAMDSDYALYDRVKVQVDPYGEKDCIIVKMDCIEHKIENTLSEKPIDMSNLIIYPSEEVKDLLVGKRIGISSTNFYLKRVFKMDPDYIKTNGFTFKLDNFIGKSSKSHFRVYIDGKRTSLFEITPCNYNETLTITNIIPEGSVGWDEGGYSQDVVIEYIGFNEKVLFSTTINNLKETNDEILYLENFLETPFNKLAFKIYIDGYRISDDQIKIVSQGNMIMINPTYYPFTDDSIITVYQQGHDKNFFKEEMLPYQFLDEVVQNDPVFRQYLINKYK